MKTKIAEIKDVREYGHKGVRCEPSRAEIAKAIEEKKFEEREFQKDINSLLSEWDSTEISPEESNRLATQYHARRIAYFVVNGWNKPIVLREDGSLKDGLHRIRAAMFQGIDTIDAIFICGSAPKTQSVVKPQKSRRE